MAQVEDEHYGHCRMAQVEDEQYGHCRMAQVEDGHCCLDVCLGSGFLDSLNLDDGNTTAFY